MNACSAAGQFIYASGDAPPPICSYGGVGMYEAGSRGGCSSPSPGYSQFKDLSGNAAEWEDSCDSANLNASCNVRGGSYANNNNATALRCDATRTVPRMPTAPTDLKDIGIRCCVY